MEHLVLSLFSLVILFAGVLGSTNDCVVYGNTFKKGEHFYPLGKCMEIYCEGNNKIKIIGCPAFSTPKRCEYIAMDSSKPYPECCPIFKC